MEEALTASATLDECSSPDQEEVEGQTSQWLECYSDNGERYFANMATGETSWTKPGSDYEQQDQIGSWPVVDAESTAAAISVGGAIAAVEQDTVTEDSGEVTQWLELYDPQKQAMYYFTPQSGEVRWEPPLEPTNLVRQCDSDAVLSAVVSLQSAARSQQARARVTAMRQQKMNDHLDESYIDKEVSRSLTLILAELNESAYTGAAPSSMEDAAPANDDSQWVEVFDPATQQQYYYSPRTSEARWDPPETFVSSLEDRQVAAAISIQSVSRGRIARKQAQELRTQSPLHHTQHPFQDESESETTRCREMRHQELLQIESGDQFWGLDSYECELLHKKTEEEKAEASDDQDSSSSPQLATEICISLDYLDFEDEEMDPERLQQEQQEEECAQVAMCREETVQCQNGDTFWGIQAEESRQHAANFAMAQEDAASRRFAENVLEQALSATWEAEVQHNATHELATRGGHEQRMQTRYLRWFYQQCVSVDELLDYRWPTKKQQDCLPSPVKRRHHPVVRPELESVASATPYPLDDLVFRDRLEHGDLRYGLRSVLTVHYQGARGTNKALSHSRSQSTPEWCISYSRIFGQVSPFSTPDPHIPARFNGVPYKPNQMSPTRDILSGDHRKLNQLPSLAQHKPTESPKLRQLQKAKAKARTYPKVSSPVDQQSPNKNGGADSAREREVEQSEDDGPQAQFKRQEHDVLSKLFSLMDLDGSGTVNQDEMRWALQRDAEIHALATTSPLLRILSNSVLIRKRYSPIEERVRIWTRPIAVAVNCRGMNLWRDNRGLGGHTRAAFISNHQDETSARETEARTIRRVFALLDSDANGVVDVAEVQRTLYNSTATTHQGPPGSGSVYSELRTLVESSRALQPMLHQELFMTAFTEFEPLDPRGISENEFVAFCLEIAQVAAANNMVATVG
ncbi:hypothetical protein GN244_ATG20974 [Phytophthora infestans]|uniref:Calmodulin n=1 Tax=Phytophthora infestans TaxID=4787 RepID=A0A833WHC1_PHYIN|nr:hypothetical protein GN244_ATG20974 [Phytophthora infestans]